MSYFRNMKTTSERRRAVADEDEGHVRAKRNARSLPSAWDDVSVKARDDRSWKKFRKTKFKPK